MEIKLGSILPEAVITITHFVWISGWWLMGSMIMSPIGTLMALGSSFAYFFIAKRVIQFLTKGEYGGIKLNQIFKAQTSTRRTKRRR